MRRGLGEIHAALLAHVVDYPPKDANGALAACDELASIIVEPVETLRRGQLTTSSTVKSSEGEKLTVGLSTKGASLDAGLNESSQSEVSRTSTFAVTTEDKVIFPALHVALKIVGGEPILKGTRVTLKTVLASLAEGATTAEILADFPTLSEEDVRAAIAFAAASAQEDLPLAETPVKR